MTTITKEWKIRRYVGPGRLEFHDWGTVHAATYYEAMAEALQRERAVLTSLALPGQKLDPDEFELEAVPADNLACVSSWRYCHEG